MARTQISVNTPSSSGMSVHTGADVAADVANGNAFLNDGDPFLLCRNSNGATTRNLTIQSPLTPDGLAVTAVTVAIPASTIFWLGPFPGRLYTQADGMVYINGDANDLFFQLVDCAPLGG